MGIVGGPVVPIAVTMAVDAALLSLFAGGRGIRTIVRHDENGLFVLAGERRVALPLGAEIPPGSEVLVRIERGSQGPRLTIQPIAPAAAEPVTPANPLARVLAGTVPGADIARFASLVPKGLPASEAVVRAIVELFFVRGVTPDRVVLAHLIAAAAEKKVLQPETAERLRGLLLGDGEEITPEHVAVAANRARAPIEAKLATRLATAGAFPQGDPVAGDLRAELLALKNDATFTQFVKSTGKFKEFEQISNGLVQRLTGEHLQNAQQPSVGYAFFEVPWTGGQMTSPQIHVFEEGAESDAHFRPSWTVVIDVELSKLGPLWITLMMQSDTCRCSIRAPREETVETLQRTSTEISEALSSIGFTHVEVSAESAREGRLDALVALSKRISGVNVSA